MNEARCHLLLIEILRLTKEHRRTPRPEGHGQGAAKVEYDQVAAFGPRTATLSGGNLTGAGRTMLSRDLRTVEAEGLVELTRAGPFAERVTNVTLTAEGEQVAITARDG
jgi:hypothetical protein